MAAGETLIVGAGPTGLTAAIALARQGHAVRVFEKRREASNLSRAVGILPRTMRALDALGAAEAIREESLVIKRVRLSRLGRRIGELDLSDAVAPEHQILALPQDRTETLLRETLEGLGGAVEFGRAFADLVQDPDGVDVTDEAGATERFEHVVGCDGVGSPVRQAVNVGFPGYDLPGEWSIADVDVAGDFDPHRVFIDTGDRETRIAIAIPIGPRRIRIIARRPDALEGLPFPIEVAKVNRASPFTIQIRQAENYVTGRVLLAGDAAHCHSPVGGRGMNLGMIDAIAAADAVTSGDLAGYAQARHAEGEKTIRETEALRKPMTSGSPLVPVLLRTVGFVLKSSRRARIGVLRRLTSF